MTQTNVPAVAQAPASPPSPAPQRSGALVLMARDIKIAHSVFALPFAVLGAFLASPWGGPAPAADSAPAAPFAGKLALIVACMVAARTWAMLFNRLADRRIDSRNTRTAGRTFASGQVSPFVGWAAALTSAALFVGFCALFRFFWSNSWPLYLSIPVLLWIAFYSLTKRFTALCHLFLGGALAVSPIAAAIAVDPTSLTRIPALYWLAGFVLFWVAGFDVIYALQDEDFDRKSGLRSIPAAVGRNGAALIARGFHLLAALCLAAAWTTHMPAFGPVFAAAAALVLLLLVFEHIIVARRGNAGIPMAFFTLNGVVSCLLGAAGIADLFL